MRILALILSLVSFQNLKADDQANLYLIGTIHNLHKSSSFTEEHFTSILQKVSPDLVLLEFPVDWFDQDGNPDSDLKSSLEDESNKDGIRDGQLAWKYCQSYKIPCRPFDMIGRNAFFKKNRVFQRLATFNDEIFRFSQKDSFYSLALQEAQRNYESCKNQSPAILNSVICDDTHNLLFKITDDLFNKANSQKELSDPEFYPFFQEHWGHRNLVMTENICKLSSKYAAKKIVIVSGVDHHSTLLPLLKQCSSGHLVSPDEFLNISPEERAKK